MLKEVSYRTFKPLFFPEDNVGFNVKNVSVKDIRYEPALVLRVKPVAPR